MPHGLLYNAQLSDGILSFTDSQGRTICNADIRKYLTFTATENNSSVALKKVGTVGNTYEYKLNNGAWTSYSLTTSGRAITLNAGDIIKWRCTRHTTTFGSSTYVQFVMRGKIEASNPVTSIVLYNLNPLSLGGYNCACYALFRDCTSLTKAPELPATTLSYGCYWQMFYGCSSLTQAPALPATTITEECYDEMFFNCTSLVQAPALPATTVFALSYNSMFYGCSSLTQAPALPATTLANRCYSGMFKDCISLTNAPVLPATELVSYCYGTTFASGFLHGMFTGCTNLHEVHVAATNRASVSDATEGWLSGVSQVGDMFCSPTGWPSGVDGIPSGWNRWVYGGTYVEDITLYLNGVSKVCQLGTSPFGTCYSDNWVGYKTLSEIQSMGYSLSAQESVTLYLFGDAPVTAYKVPYVADNPDGFTEDMYWASYWTGTTIGYKWMTASELEDQDLYLAQTQNARKPLTFTATENNSSVALKRIGAINGTYAYRLNDGAWTPYNLTANGVAIPLDAGDRVQFYCTTSNSSFTTSKYLQFVMTGKVEASGHTTSILRRKLNTTTLNLRCYYSLFKDCISLTQAPLLPSTVLSANCYQSMFQGCTSLTQAPVLSATTLANYCYQSMFQGCTSLTQAPALPATTLKLYCYNYMFSGCTSLTQAPALDATTLAEYCYSYVFEGCRSLTQAPVLPATTLANYCYQAMFDGCISLTQAPALPATTLADGCYEAMFIRCTSLTQVPTLNATTLNERCYNGMFQECTSLTQAPTLPATTLAYACYNAMFKECTSLVQAPALPVMTLADSCYAYMFQGCVSLTQAPVLPATTLANGCYEAMFSECLSLTQAPVLPATTLANGCYKAMFEKCSVLTQAPELPATTLANTCYMSMFSGCTSLSEIRTYATNPTTGSTYGSVYQWLENVSTTGDFYCEPNVTWDTGVSGIPSGWRRLDINYAPQT